MPAKFPSFYLKGQCDEIFCLRFFNESSSPKPLKITLVHFKFFPKNSRKYSQVKVHHQYQRHRWQILPPVPLVLLIPGANLPPVSMIPVANLPPVSTIPAANCPGYQRHLRQICQWEQYQTTDNLK